MSSSFTLGKDREAFNKWTSEKKVLLKRRIFWNSNLKKMLPSMS